MGCRVGTNVNSRRKIPFDKDAASGVRTPTVRSKVQRTNHCATLTPIFFPPTSLTMGDSRLKNEDPATQSDRLPQSNSQVTETTSVAQRRHRVFPATEDNSRPQVETTWTMSFYLILGSSLLWTGAERRGAVCPEVHC